MVTPRIAYSFRRRAKLHPVAAGFRDIVSHDEVVFGVYYHL